MASPTQWAWVWANWVKHREAWHALVRGVAKSQTWLRDWTTATQRFVKIILGPYLKSQSQDFSYGAEVKTLPSNAGIRRFNSIPGWGTKMPYAAGQLIPHAWTREPACRTYWACKQTQYSQRKKMKERAVKAPDPTTASLAPWIPLVPFSFCFFFPKNLSPLTYLCICFLFTVYPLKCKGQGSLSILYIACHIEGIQWIFLEWMNAY